MKNIKQVLLSTGIAAGLLAATTGFGADTQPAAQPAPTDPNPPTQPPADAPAPDEQPVAQPVQQTTPVTNAPVAVTPAVTPAAPDTNAPAVDSEGKIRFNFRGTPMDQVLTYMSKTAGYIVLPTRSVDLSTKLTAWSDQPVTRDEALALLKQVMSANGYQVIVNDRTLEIVPSLQVKKMGIPVVLLKGSSSDVPRTSDIMTYIIPVRSLNAVQLIRDLQPLLPAETTLTANESGNSLVMTDSQMNVRRVVEIVKALDSVSSSSSTITVFPLKFADAKTLAALIKDLFPATDAAGGGRGNPFARMSAMFGGGGRGGGGGDTGGSDTGNGHTPTTRVTAVADDRSNSLAVSSPDEMVSTISELINQLDTNVQDLTEMHSFKLKNADPIETADLLTKLFPDTSKTDDNNNGFSGRRFGGFGGMGMQTGNTGSSSNDRTKKINQVVAVPDPRTGSVVVTAGKDMMPQIASLIDTLDQDPAGKQKVLVFQLKNADPADVQQVLNDLFPSNNKTGSSTSTAASALATRNQTMQNNQNSATSSPFGGSGGSGGRSIP